MARLLLCGCTLSTDHHYVFPNDRPGIFQALVEAAQELGLRFHACRGSMSLGESAGGLPPDSVVEEEDAILVHTEAMINRYHDPKPGAMTRVVVAPCSPFSVTRKLMQDSATLARKHGVRLHTHLAETLDEERFCIEKFGRRPVELMEDLGWTGDDVWYAHGIHLNDAEIDRVAEVKTGIAHCPSSNMRLGAGMCRGAECLGRDDCGTLEPGKCADIACFRVDDLAHAGIRDLVAALVLAPPSRAQTVVVNGRAVVREGRLLTGDENQIAREIAATSERLAG